jgi:hypothetical protein
MCDQRQDYLWSGKHCPAHTENIKIDITEIGFERMDWTESDARWIAQ